MKRKFTSLLVILALILPVFNTVSFATESSIDDTYRAYVKMQVKNGFTDYGHYLYYLTDFSGDGLNELVVRENENSYSTYTVANAAIQKIKSDNYMFISRYNNLDYYVTSGEMQRYKNNSWERAHWIWWNNNSDIVPDIENLHNHAQSALTTEDDSKVIYYNGITQTENFYPFYYYIDDEQVTPKEYGAFIEDTLLADYIDYNKFMTYDEFIGGEIPDEEEETGETNNSIFVEFLRFDIQDNGSVTYKYRLVNNSNTYYDTPLIIVFYNVDENSNIKPAFYSVIESNINSNSSDIRDYNMSFENLRTKELLYFNDDNVNKHLFPYAIIIAPYDMEEYNSYCTELQNNGIYNDGQNGYMYHYHYDEWRKKRDLANDYFKKFFE